MKKNYFEPKMTVSKIVLAQMIATSPGEGDIQEEPHEGGFGTKEEFELFGAQGFDDSFFE